MGLIVYALAIGDIGPYRKKIVTWYNRSSNVFLVITIALFTFNAYRHHRHAFKEYGFKFSLSLFGLIQLQTVNFFLTQIASRDNTLLSIEYLKLQSVQSFSVLLFVVFKQPVDLFSVFNKRSDIQFSIF